MLHMIRSPVDEEIQFQLHSAGFRNLMLVLQNIYDTKRFFFQLVQPEKQSHKLMGRQENVYYIFL